jgi:circadian clock protein KaiC
MARIDTGVPGLDEVLNGGLLSGGVYIVEGAPGCGKTILGNQICFHRAGAGDSTVYITLLAESHTRMIAHLRGLQFFRAELIGKSIYYVSAFKILEESGLDGLLKSIRDTIRERSAGFVVLDGLVSAEEFADSPRDFKKFIHELQTVTGMNGSTVLLLSSTERGGEFRPEHTMVDGIIELGDTLAGVQSLRHLLVRKMRGTSQLRGRHALDISDAGIKIRPRIETSLRRPEENEPPPPTVARAEFGITGLDAMLRGGLPGASSTLLVGPSGSGKTVLGLQFLAAGVEHDQVGLYVGFYERPGSLLQKDVRLGLGLARAHDEKRVHFFWEAPIEGVLDAVVDRLLRAVTQYGVRRLCFDGLHGFRHHAEYPERTRAVFSALAAELTRRGVTAVYTIETSHLVGPTIEVPIDGVSALADNIIVLRHVEHGSQLRRLLSILKLRDSDYDAGVREFTISDHGLRVADTFDTADAILRTP